MSAESLAAQPSEFAPLPSNSSIDIQVFVVLTNLSAAAPAPSSSGRKLLQASQQPAASDQVLFQILVVPRSSGSSPLERPPSEPALLFFGGLAAAGYVLLYDQGSLLSNITLANGSGSVSLSIARGSHFYSAAYSGSGAFPGSAASAVFKPDGSLQVAAPPPVRVPNHLRQMRSDASSTDNFMRVVHVPFVMHGTRDHKSWEFDAPMSILCVALHEGL